MQNLVSSLPQNLRGIIFDCDGVLFDSRESNAHFFNIVMREAGRGPLTPEEAHYGFIHSVDETFVHTLTPEQIAGLDFARISEAYDKEALPKMNMHAHLKECLRFLQEKGFRLGVFTNRKDSMETVIRTFGLEGFFDPVMTLSVVPPKPNPEGLFRVVDAWGFAKEEIVFIGDSVLDEKSAEAAGMTFWAYGNKDLSASWHITSFVEMHNVLAAYCDAKARG